MVRCCRMGLVLVGISLSLLGVALACVPSPASPMLRPPSASATAPEMIESQRGGKMDSWTMFGGTPARNLVNTLAKKVLTDWSVAKGKEKNIKWKADLGTRAYGGPVMAGGKVYVGTDNGRPRDPKKTGNYGALMCFNEADGTFLWQVLHEMPAPKIADQALEDGLCSTPSIDGDKLYYLAPACQLVCAEAANGKEVWKLDMMKELKVYPCFLASGAPLVVGDTVFTVTGNGTDAKTHELKSPDAPSFIAVNKKDGTEKWKSNLPGKNIIEGQWGSPAWAEVNGKAQVIFPGGDCYLYSFEPDTGKLLWKFNCGATREAAAAKKLEKISNYLVATPVVYDNKVYIGTGMYPESPVVGRVGHFWCVDLVKAMANGGMNKDHDVSPAQDNFDPKAKENANSALAWHYGGDLVPPPKFGRKVVFGRTISTAAIHDGLVYITEEAGYLHCLDAATGKKYWDHDLDSGVWGSPMWVDDKVYIGTEAFELMIFKHGKQKQQIGSIDMGAPVQCPVVVANQTLFVQTKVRLYAIGK